MHGNGGRTLARHDGDVRRPHVCTAGLGNSDLAISAHAAIARQRDRSPLIASHRVHSRSQAWNAAYRGCMLAVSREMRMQTGFPDPLADIHQSAPVIVSIHVYYVTHTWVD